MYSPVKVKSDDYPDLPFVSFALIDEFGGGVIMEVIKAQGADAAIDYFDKFYPNRHNEGKTVWLLVGGEKESDVD